MPDDIPKIPRYRGKRNKPKDSVWRQQRIPAYRPVINTRNTLPCTIVVGFIFIGVGVLLMVAASSSLELVIKYTNCTSMDGNATEKIVRIAYPNVTAQCRLSFDIMEDYSGEVKFYYGLTQFYQNHRLYMNSRNDLQLAGHIREVTDCKPLDSIPGTNLTYAPCGFVANSMFNDTFQLLFHGLNAAEVEVPFTTRGMVKDLVRKRKFRNPVPNGNETLCDAFADTVRPPWWQKDICELGANSPGAGVGFENIDFIMWMQTAALPNFRKLYRILDREVDGFSDGLPIGRYTLVINYNYPATWRGAEKSFVISRESWIGPRRDFLAISYMAVGTGAVFCSSMVLGWIAGHFAYSLWLGSSFNCVVLALNRYVEMMPMANNFQFLFHGRTVYMWIVLSLAYTLVAWFVFRPAPFNSTVSAFIGLPMIKDYDWEQIHFTSVYIVIHNCTVVVTLVTLYSIVCCHMWHARGTAGYVTHYKVNTGKL
ncbi:unnamed protein product [Cylicocyclus nassatus]|uniref:Transmembrane protein n=1 Tax=Cylicocyclus nassatus TaxID=53992 RepID=A0AA36H4P9_CYLNA|nr:unnamed protein product [Cylicocyclus nassatus]